MLIPILPDTSDARIIQERCYDNLYEAWESCDSTIMKVVYKSKIYKFPEENERYLEFRNLLKKIRNKPSKYSSEILEDVNNVLSDLRIDISSES